MDVTIVRCDVEIAGQEQPRIARKLLAEPPGQCLEPCQLVGVFVAADGLTIRYVGADDADVADCRRQQSFLLVGVQRIAVHDACRLFAGQQGDAVVGLLSGENNVIACCLDLLPWKSRVVEFGFLQADDVRSLARQPVEQLRQAHLQ